MSLNRDKYLPIVAQIFADQHLPPELGAGIARQESDWDPSAQALTGGDARMGGSYGLCQVSLETAQSLDPGATVALLLNPSYNCTLAARLCRLNWNRAHGRIQDVISLYNSGKEFHNAPESTKLVYVPNVQKYMAEYKETCAKYRASGHLTLVPDTYKKQ